MSLGAAFGLRCGECQVSAVISANRPNLTLETAGAWPVLGWKHYPVNFARGGAVLDLDPWHKISSPALYVRYGR